MKKLNIRKYGSIAVGSVLLILSSVHFMQLQADYVRSKDEKQILLAQAEQRGSVQPTVVPTHFDDEVPSEGSIDAGNSEAPIVSAEISDLLNRAQTAVDDVSSMQMEYPVLLSKIGRQEHGNKDAEQKAIADVIALREERLKPYFPNDSGFRERWFSEHERVDPVTWSGVVANQLNDGDVFVLWMLRDKDDHVLAIVTALYDGESNSFHDPVLHWTSQGANAVAYTGNGDDIDGEMRQEDTRSIDEFIQSVQEIIGLPSLNQNGGK